MRPLQRWSVPLAVTLPAASGVVAAAVLPRGPVTGAAVLVLMTTSAAVGGAAGLLLRSRWAVLAAPALHLAGYELARAVVFRLDGPTMGPPRFDVTMGVLVFVSVHVMYAVVAGAPMAVGAIVGAAVARHRRVAAPGVPASGPTAPYGPADAGVGTPGPAGRIAARVGLITRSGLALVLLAGVVTLGVALVRPSRVAPVLGPDGRAVPGSVATLEKVRLGGVDQWVSMRGRSEDNPVLLHLSGGPGSSDVGWVRTFNQPLEDRFTVVVWEQRGAGKSYPALSPTGGLTLDQMVRDGLELSRWLAQRFGQDRIYLTGNSWGSTLGVLMAQRSPELYYAYVGTGQMVSQRETDRVLYHQLLDHAARVGDAGLHDQLVAFGEPPYRDVLAYAKVIEYYDVIEPYQHEPAFEKARGLTGFFPAEYSLVDTWNEIRGFADMGGLLYPQLAGIDFRTDVPNLAVPVYFVQGRHELTARSRFADEWIASLQAPIKRLYVFERSGHNADAEEPARYNDLMINTVLPETYQP